MTKADAPPSVSNGHAKLSPSSSERWIACPGSIAAQAEVFDPDEDDSNPDSRLGTAAHALLEACLLLGAEPAEFMGARLAGDKCPEVTEDMCEWVQTALTYIEEYVDTYGEENLWILPESNVLIGPQIGITGDDDRDAELCNGTGDCILAHRDMSMCVVIDYKNGVARVDAKENPQCMLYAAGARQMFGKFKKYRSVIVQPRAAKRNTVDEWEFSDATLRHFLAEKARPSARAALLPNAPRSAGDHCRYCKAGPRCRTRKTKAYALAGVEFAALDDEPDPRRLSDSEFLAVLDHTKFIEDYLHSVRGYALRMLENNPLALPGWKLGWAKRMRLWDDEVKVIEFCKQRKLLQDDYAPRGLLSPAQLTKLLRRRLKPARRKRGEPEAPNPLEAFVKYSIPNPKLIRDDAGEDFDPVEEE